MPGYGKVGGVNTNRDQPAATSGDSHHGVMGTFNDIWWRDNYSELDLGHSADRPDRGYEYYQPAFRYGWESRSRYSTKPWEEVEPELSRGWDAQRRDNDAGWNDVKHAVRHAFDRAVHVFQGGPDPDKR